jgi:hypothetical protein
LNWTEIKTLLRAPTCTARPDIVSSRRGLNVWGSEEFLVGPHTADEGGGSLDDSFDIREGGDGRFSNMVWVSASGTGL